MNRSTAGKVRVNTRDSQQDDGEDVPTTKGSETASATPLAAPEAVDDLEATAGVNSIALQWDPARDETISKWEYRVGDAEWKDIPGSDATTTTHSIPKLPSGMELEIFVRAIAGQTNGPDGVAADATPKPAAPTGLKAVAGEELVTLSWKSPSVADSGITRYEYSQKKGDGDYGDWEPIENAVLDDMNTMEVDESLDRFAREVVAAGLENKATYSYKLRVVAGDLNAEAAKAVSATPAEPTTSILNRRRHTWIRSCWVSAKGSKLT